MLRLLRKIMHTGTVTEDYFMSAVPARFRGQLEVRDKLCASCRKCLDICPVGALAVSEKRLAVNHDACIFCGRCVEVCAKDGVRHTLHYECAHLAGQLEPDQGVELSRKIRAVLGR